MKVFLVENSKRNTTIKVTLNQPPYENENILYKTGWKEKDCIIKEVYSGWREELQPPDIMNKEIEDE